MDGISFDSLHYLSDEAFVIECNDDFSGFEDLVRFASATHFVDQLDPLGLESGSDSPPSSSYYSSGRCFDKEIPSLFSEMEYLTEVTPDTEMAIVPNQNVPIAVDPSEFSWIRKEKKAEDKTESTTRLMEEARSPADDTSSTKDKPTTNGRYLDPLNYRKILQNYIQKGKRKLEETSYSKMKATVMSVKSGTHSTSLIETVTCASYAKANPSSSSTATARGSHLELGSAAVTAQCRQESAAVALPPNYRCHDCNSCFLSVERLKKHPCIIAEQYQCQLCRREFRKRKTLEQHIKSHDKVFSTDDDLRK